MFELWTPLRDIPAEGREFSFSDPAIWTSAWSEFGVECAMAEPLAATVQVIPGGNGFLIRGNIAGSVTVPCDNCAEDAVIVLQHDFEEFEPLPESQGDAQDPDASQYMRGEGVDAEIDMAALLWEQFQLAMPGKPLCREDCKGLCPKCGVNLNQGSCDCADEEGDPRFAALRNVKLS